MMQQSLLATKPKTDDEVFRRLEAGEGTPLIHQTESSEALPALPPDASLKEKAVTVGAGIGVVSNALSLFLSAHPVAMCSSILGLVLSPVAAFQQRKITQARALEKTNKVMKEQVEKLQHENSRLQDQEKQIGTSVLK
jgi:hypothetical protein